MTITVSRLTAAAGLCAAAAGAVFIAVQINHPPADVAHIVTTEMVVRETAKVVMTVLALVGFTGMFLHQHRRFGILGLAGYLLLTVGYLAMFAVQCIVAYVLPTVARSDPGYVQDVLDAAVGGSPRGDIGSMHELLLVSGIGFSIGGLLFGIALFRAGVLARWACVLFAYGTTSALALSVLPESFNRPFAVPTGVALIGLGISLWRDRRRSGRSDVMDIGATAYELRIAGHLDRHWSTWFGGLEITHEDGRTTTLRGVVADQSELHGLLTKIRDLGTPLISVTSRQAPSTPMRTTNAGSAR